MSIKNAMNLIKHMKTDEELRNSLYKLAPTEIDGYLQNRGYKFSMFEFEDTINIMHLKCQTYEEADELLQIAMWFRLLKQYE